MLRDIFGEFGDGRIGRGRFIPWSLLLAALFLGAALALGFLAGVVERLGIEPTTVGSKRATGLLALATFSACGIAFTVGMLNLAAKRARDIGWNALLGMLLIAVFPGIGWLVLALVPGRTQRDG